MLGDRFKSIRKEKGLTQKAFAAALATSSGYISEIEAGKKIPGGELLTSLKRVFNVDINWLLVGESGGCDCQQPNNGGSPRPQQQQKLLDAFNAAEEPIRDAALTMLENSAQKLRKKSCREANRPRRSA